MDPQLDILRSIIIENLKFLNVNKHKKSWILARITVKIDSLIHCATPDIP